MVENLGLIITFAVLNAIVIIYGFILIIYGKYFRKDDLFLLVTKYNNINFYLILLQENFGDNIKAIPRIEESIRSPNDAYSHIDEKKINLIEA